MEQVLSLIKSRNYQLPELFLKNYKKLNLSDQEFILLFYIWNLTDFSYNPKQISNDLGITMGEVLEIINTLYEKGFLEIKIVKVNNKRTEILDIELLYEKLSFLLIKEEKKEKKSDLFSVFEKELGRTLSPTEIELIRGWLSSYSEELIVLALKEGIYNGVTSFRYIDRIIFEWNKKGIKTKEDVENNRKEFKKPKIQQELFDYDWLNDSQDS